MLATWGEPTIVDAGDGAGRSFRFGSSADLEGDMAVFGQELGSSAVVFERDPSCSNSPWCIQTTLNIPDGEPDRVQDVAVSESTATVIIGASRDGGAGYVFVKCGSDWCLQKQLEDFVNPIFGQGFGRGVAIEGDTAVVGAVEGHNECSSSDPNCNAGAAYVFERINDTWQPPIELRAQIPTTGSWFGRSVAISGDTIIVGAPFDENTCQDGSTCNAGAAYVFERDLGGNWGQVAKLVAIDADADDNFGRSVTIEDDTVVVGAFGEDGAGRDSGAAYVFQPGLAGWTDGSMNQVAKLTASDAARSHQFGKSVSISGESIVVGAPVGEAAYVFEEWNDCGVTPCVLNEDAKLVASESARGDSLGASVGISGDTAVVGAPNVNTSVGRDAGLAYVFVKQQPSPGITVSPNSGLLTTETGGTDTFDVVLDTQPVADVTIDISSNDTTEGTVDKTSLTFTLPNWNVPQTVTVTGIDDPDPDGDAAYTIVTAAAVSTDTDYSGFDASDVSVINLDNEVAAGATVTSISPESMPINSTIEVTIAGSGFVVGADVTFAGSRAPSASNILVVNTTQITATVTSHKKFGGLYDVIVTNLDGSSGVLPGGFAVNVAAPAAAAISPRQLPGDTNLDGEIDFSDFTILARNFGQEGNLNHADGNFDGDRDVDFSDFLILAHHFNRPRDPGWVHSRPLPKVAVDLSLADATAGQTDAGWDDALQSAIEDVACACGT